MAAAGRQRLKAVEGTCVAKGTGSRAGVVVEAQLQRVAAGGGRGYMVAKSDKGREETPMRGRGRVVSKSRRFLLISV